MVDFFSLANAEVQTLAPYQPGKPIEELRRESGIQDIIKLASNENPLGASPKAMLAAQQALEEIALYPEGSGFALKHALAKRLKIDSNTLTLGNGSDNILAMLVQAFVRPQQEVIMSEYGFATFAIVTTAHKAVPVLAPCDHYSDNVDSFIQAISDKTRMIFIANPNNPTGSYLSQDKLVYLLQNIPNNILVVLDEAYYEYADASDYPNTLQLRQQFANLIIVRTFSKAYGLAGLRIGYCISDAQVADILNRVRLPFNVNCIAAKAATAALEDEEHIAKSTQLNCEGKQQIISALTSLGLTYLPSQTNFITIDLKQAAMPIYQHLLSEGIIVRPLLPYRMPNHLRVSIGTALQNERFIEALQKILIKGN